MEVNIRRLHSHSNEEMKLIDKLVNETKRNLFLEIGAYHFELSEYFLEKLPERKGRVISVDWKNQFEVKCSSLQKTFKDRFKFILGDTMSLDTIAMIKTDTKGNRVDVVFIDGGHTYPMVKSDTKNYADLVADDGYIMWHDACSRIVPFIEELKAYSCPIEIYEDNRGLAYIKGDRWKEWKKSM